MALRAVRLLVPSKAPDPAALKGLPRRLASAGLAGVYTFRLLALARALAETALLGRETPAPARSGAASTGDT